MLPRFRAGAFWLFALVFVTTLLLGDQAFVEQYVPLDPARIVEAQQLWSPLTASFLDAGAFFGGVALTLLIQWFLGGPLEGFWGTKKYLLLVVPAAVFGYALTAGLAFATPIYAQLDPMSGPLALNVATLTAFTVVFGKTPYRPFEIGAPLKGWMVGGMALLLLFAIPLFERVHWATLTPAVGAALVALLVTTQPWRAVKKSGKVARSKGRSKERSHLRLVKDADDLLN